jgi:hypothetical protein
VCVPVGVPATCQLHVEHKMNCTSPSYSTHHINFILSMHLRNLSHMENLESTYMKNKNFFTFNYSFYIKLIYNYYEGGC